MTPIEEQSEQQPARELQQDSRLGRWLGFPAAALALGVFCSHFMSLFWAWLVRNNPVAEWLLKTLAPQGHELLYGVAIYAHDFMINLVVSLPFVYLVSRLKPLASIWLFLLFAASFELYQSWHLIPVFIEFINSIGVLYVIGLIVTIGPMLVNFLLIRSLLHRIRREPSTSTEETEETD